MALKKIENEIDKSSQITLKITLGIEIGAHLGGMKRNVFKYWGKI